MIPREQCKKRKWADHRAANNFTIFESASWQSHLSSDHYLLQYLHFFCLLSKAPVSIYPVRHTFAVQWTVLTTQRWKASPLSTFYSCSMDGQQKCTGANNRRENCWSYAETLCLLNWMIGWIQNWMVRLALLGSEEPSTISPLMNSLLDTRTLITTIFKLELILNTNGTSIRLWQVCSLHKKRPRGQKHRQGGFRWVSQWFQSIRRCQISLQAGTQSFFLFSWCSASVWSGFWSRFWKIRTKIRTIVHSRLFVEMCINPRGDFWLIPPCRRRWNRFQVNPSQIGEVLKV